MKTLVLTENLKSFAAVARDLKVTPAAVSKQLILLERELGLSLLKRTTRSVSFTEIGFSYVEQCKRILEEADIASSLVEQMKAKPQGKLKILSSPYFASAYIIPHIKEFLKAYPGIRIDLEIAERLPDLDREGIDIVIGMSLKMTGNVIQKQISTEKTCYCASPAYLKKWGIPKKPEDLKKHRHIVHSLKKDLIEPYIRVNDSKTMIELALMDLGIIKTQFSLVSGLIKEKKLVELLESEHAFPLYAAFPERRYVPSKLRHFLDFICSKILSSAPAH